MAFRLFGIGSKKTSGASGAGSGNTVTETTATSDTEEFMVVDPSASSVNALANDPSPPSYAKQPKAEPAFRSQTSCTGWPGYLEGVPFVLSEGVTGSEELDTILARIEVQAERLNSLGWVNIDYDFIQEKQVLSQDVTATMKRLHMAAASP